MLLVSLGYDRHRPQPKGRGSTVGIKTLLRRFTALNKSFRWWPNQGDHEGEMLERIVITLFVENVCKQMVSFKEVADLISQRLATVRHV